MTHTLHRMGKEQSLKRDFVLLMMPSKGVNHKGSGAKLRRFLEICRDLGAIKIGDARLGNEYHQGGQEKMLGNVEDLAVVQAVFTDPKKVAQAIKAVKEADFGLSLVISGLFQEVRGCCAEAGVSPHTINESLGRWGRTDKLPSEEILSLNTMCGHGMVAVGLIEDVVERIKAKEMTPEQGGEELFKPCMCGIFNPDRAAELLRVLAGTDN